MTTPKYTGRWASLQSDGRLLCELCPRACRLNNDDRGFCFVRQNLDGKMILDTYGRSTGFCIDPIEKKPLNHFFPGTSVLSFGTAGCNLGCKFCQNWDISKSKEVARLSNIASPEDIAVRAAELDCRSVAFTYNDPVIWAEYAIDTAIACRQRDIKTVAVTAGYITPQARAEFFSHMDAANIDLKAFTERFYQKVTSSHLQPVLDTIAYVCNETDCWVELTNLVIPGENDDPQEIAAMCKWIIDHIGADVPLHFSAFHPDFRMQDKPRTPHVTLIQAYDIAKTTGIKFVYIGNVHDTPRQTTYCPNCGCALIARNWYELETYRVASSRCPQCDTSIAGKFADQPGKWGRRRERVEFNRNTKHSSLPQKGSLEMKSSAAQLNFTQEELQTLHGVASLVVQDAVLSARTANVPAMLADLSERQVHGVFVTLKRGETLRGCCGYLGTQMSLGEALTNAAIRTAKHDPRMPPVQAAELQYLTLSISILGPCEDVRATAQDRLHAIEIGKHGVRIAMSGRSGLLLPIVAVENGWDAEQLLDAVCRKANLPLGSWRTTNCQLQTFEGLYFSQPLQLPTPESSETTILNPDEIQSLTNWLRSNMVILHSGATPNYYLAGVNDCSVHCLMLQFRDKHGQQSDPLMRVRLVKGMPLQSTLFEMTQLASQMIPKIEPNFSVDFAVGSHVIHHGLFEDADLNGIQSRQRIVCLTDGRNWACGYDSAFQVDALMNRLWSLERFDRSQTQVYSMLVAANLPHMQASIGMRPNTSQDDRSPAVSGTFYPRSDHERNALVESFIRSENIIKQTTNAVMVPHAGLRYSGRVATKVFQSIDIPKSIIVFSPKHTSHGLDWAVAPCRRWMLSAHSWLENDLELASSLVQNVDALQFDAQAHQAEHGIELQLPIIHLLAPETKVVGVTVHGGDFNQLRNAARQLASWLDQLVDRPLLVISSDMNHFADEAENRRRDRLALDALSTGDAAHLLDVCDQHRVSMCGRLPAALVLQTLTALNIKLDYRELAYATSADVTKDHSRVVGYAGVLL